MVPFYWIVTGFMGFLFKLLHMWFPTILLDCPLREETIMLTVISYHKVIFQKSGCWLMTAVVSQGFLVYLLFQLPTERHGSQKLCGGGVAEKDGQSSIFNSCWNGTINPDFWEPWNSHPILSSGWGGASKTGMDTWYCKVLASDSLGIGEDPRVSFCWCGTVQDWKDTRVRG